MSRLIAAVTVLALYVTVPAAPASAPTSAALLGKDYEHAFLVTSQVARWDPCTVIGWRVNRRARIGLADTKTAFWRLGQATGFTFRYRGVITGVPQIGSNPWWPADTQIVVARARRFESTLFDATADADAVAGPYYLSGWQNPDGSPAYRISMGSVVIRAGLHLRGGFGLGITRGDVLLHELGHLMGLAHYPSTDEMMNPVMTRSRARYGRGDLAGLEEHGARMGCLTMNANARGG